jgi:hypothetical protein
MIESAWAIRIDPANGNHQALTMNEGTEAIVRIARKLLRRMRAVLLSGKPYQIGIVK